MKTILVSLSIMLALAASATNKNDTATCLIVSGRALIKGNQAGGIIASLYCDNKEINLQEIYDLHKKFYFKLKPNHSYTVKVFKKGFITRSVSINTTMYSHVSNAHILKFDFKIALIPESEYYASDFADFPTALVEFRSKRNVFDYSRQYTKKVKSELSHDRFFGLDSKRSLMAKKGYSIEGVSGIFYTTP